MAESGAQDASNSYTYCQYCGALAGVPTKCAVQSAGHSFVTTARPVMCRHCGVVPGEPTTCAVRRTGHAFVELDSH